MEKTDCNGCDIDCGDVINTDLHPRDIGYRIEYIRGLMRYYWVGQRVFQRFPPPVSRRSKSPVNWVACTTLTATGPVSTDPRYVWTPIQHPTCRGDITYWKFIPTTQTEKPGETNE